jgi:hypothetical protein
LRVCVREEDARGRKAGAHSTTPTYTAGKDSPAREPSWSAFWLQKPSILRVCVREEDAREREAGAVGGFRFPRTKKVCADETNPFSQTDWAPNKVGVDRIASVRARVDG